MHEPELCFATGGFGVFLYTDVVSDVAVVVLNTTFTDNSAQYGGCSQQAHSHPHPPLKRLPPSFLDSALAAWMILLTYRTNG